MTLASNFQHACERATAECEALGYSPTAWKAMMGRWGAVEAAKRLLISGDVQEGFERLVRMGRIDLTLESAVLDPAWDELFGEDPRYREAARWRLQQATPPPSAP
jgi:hypothetical protein